MKKSGNQASTARSEPAFSSHLIDVLTTPASRQPGKRGEGRKATSNELRFSAYRDRKIFLQGERFLYPVRGSGAPNRHSTRSSR
jgi:hypothetical protein